MQDVWTRLGQLNRPPLLVRAARFAARDYRREVELPRLLGGGPLPGPRQAATQLLEIEAEEEARRRAGAGFYRPAAHIAVLTAILGEARALAPSPPAAATPPTRTTGAPALQIVR